MRRGKKSVVRVAQRLAPLVPVHEITIHVLIFSLFCDINISQGGVATRLRCGWIFSYHFTANLLPSPPVKEF